MKFNKIAILTLVIGLFACDNSPYPGFDQSPNGLYYKVIPGEESDRKIELNDILTLNLKYYTDSIEIFDSKKLQFPVQIRVSEPSYYGDLMEGFLLMNVGDSAIFKASADTFYKYGGNQGRPEEIKEGEIMTFEIGVSRAQTEEEVMSEKRAEEMIMMEKEREMIAAYILENEISVEPTNSGLYFIEMAPGNGEKALRGNKVKIHAIVRDLSGQELESTYKSGNPLEFILGAGQVFSGLDEGVGYMNEGSRATMILPSMLHFGAKPEPGSNIGPYTPLVFDIELVEIIEE